MVLAAGKGTRMGAISDTLPKPMVPVAGRTLIDRILDHLAAAGIHKPVINVHHLADMLEDHLAGRAVISDERDQLLETGGGVKKALPLLGRDPVFLINSDALWTDGETSLLARMHDCFDTETMDVLLMLVRREDALGHEGAGDFLCDIMPGRPVPLAFRGTAPTAPVIFAGVQVVNPAMYDDMPEGRWSNKLIFEKAQASGRLYGLLHDGDWMHVGTPEAIREAEARLAALGAA
ncbi:MAG: nucleotidyltransferase family protein [Alphaproteobacteria bacterium]|nr:MAG: nucleotidyltransferase family protein [Alphaproteobacteria bacterium]